MVLLGNRDVAKPEPINAETIQELVPLQDQKLRCDCQDGSPLLLLGRGRVECYWLALLALWMGDPIGLACCLVAEICFLEQDRIHRSRVYVEDVHFAQLGARA